MDCPSLIRNPAYRLHCCEEESGFALLSNVNTGESIIISPLALIVYTLPDGPFLPADIPRLLSEYSLSLPATIRAHLGTVVDDLIRKKVLLSAADVTPDDVNSGETDRERLPVLRQIYLYITQGCNLRCYHCYQKTRYEQHQWNTREAEVSLEALLSVIDQAGPLGLQMVKITGGEPFLRRDITDLIRELSARGLEISIETNGTFITEQLAAFLSEQSVNISVSLDGSTPLQHDKLRGYSGAFGLTLKAIKHLVANKCTIKVISAISKLNVSDVMSIIALAADLGVSEVKINPVNSLGYPRGEKFANVLLNPVEIRSLYRQLTYSDPKKVFGINVFMEGPPALFSLQDIAMGQCGTCPFLNILGVLNNGDLSFCGVGYSEEELRLGNASNVNLKQVWESHHTLLAAREQLPEEINGICQECIFLGKCQGSCRAIAYQENHSFRDPHPWCQYLDRIGEFPAKYRADRATVEEQSSLSASTHGLGKTETDAGAFSHWRK